MRSASFGLALVLLPLLAVGCGPGEGKVSGRVLFNGAPLPGGRVTFRPADPRQNSVSAELDREGNYQAVLPAGEVQVCVDNRELEPPPAPIVSPLPPNLPADVFKALGGGKPDKAPAKPPEDAAERPPGRYVRLPNRYYTVETSGLRFKVQGGDQKHDLELTK